MPINSLNTNQQNKFDKKEFIGTLAGGVVSGLATVPFCLMNPAIIDKSKNFSNLSEDEFKKVAAGADKALEEIGLKAKGTEILRINSENRSRIAKVLDKEYEAIKKGGILSRIEEAFNTISNYVNGVKMSTWDEFLASVEKGENAFSLAEIKKIIMPEKQWALNVFHEMGHAANYNLSKIGKLLQKTRGLSVLAIPIALIAFLKVNKNSDGKPKRTWDKITDFIKNNAGKLTFLTFAPVLIEEAMASIKGNGFAKKVLSPELAEKVAKSNKIAYITYLGLALTSSIGIYIGVKAKDAITNPKHG